MLRKLISLSLVAVMLSVTAFAAGSVPTFQYADGKITCITEADGTAHSADLVKWNGKASAEAPTLEDGYYLIEDGSDLAWFAAHVNTVVDSTYPNAAANAKLVRDIDLNSISWRGYRIGNGGGFKGVFDGQGHIIYNLYQTGNYQGETGGLFHTIAGGTVKNLHLENVHINSGYGSETNLSYNAAVARAMSSGTIQKVTVSGKLTVSAGKYAGGSGSIVGDLTGGTIEDCYSNATIDYSNCGAAVQTVYTYANGNQGVGGLVGCIRGTNVVTVRRCGYGGRINAPFSSRTGGIIGSVKDASTNITLEDCYNTADITGNAMCAGILGWRTNGYYTIGTGFYNTGKITVLSDTYASGVANVIGSNYSYSTGDVVYKTESAETNGGKTALLYSSMEPAAEKYAFANQAFCNENTYTKGEGEEAVTAVKPTFFIGASGIYNRPGNGFTMAQFKDGTVLSTLGEKFVADIGINNDLPILAWQATAPLTKADEYLVTAENGLTLTLEEAGYVALDITPLGGSATVAVNGDTKTITEKGTYRFNANSNVANVTVAGRAIVKEDVMNQNDSEAIEEIVAAPIKVNLTSEENATIVLALFNGTTLEKVEYLENVAAADGYVSGIIDLTGENVDGRILKAYLWANGTLAPLENVQDL